MNSKIMTLALGIILIPGFVLGNDSIIIHTTKTGEPISKYIYGQFIEHLGRCIYGGIWAEMLEDRKFYYPITDEYKPWSIETDNGHWKGGDFPVITGSPWKVTRDEGIVSMDKENPFVGEHTPEIKLGDASAGISFSVHLFSPA